MGHLRTQLSNDSTSYKRFDLGLLFVSARWHHQNENIKNKKAQFNNRHKK